MDGKIGCDYKPQELICYKNIEDISRMRLLMPEEGFWLTECVSNKDTVACNRTNQLLAPVSGVGCCLSLNLELGRK